MSTPYRTIFKDEAKVVEAINQTMEAWQKSRSEFKIQTQGLSNFGIFSHPSSPAVLNADASINPSKKR